ncbi:REP-associated tyrosine transposase [Oceanibium sediminis]|uniref:REP-associated tyrosine transposase n=1 Tax=Oceanibium sediminis TaxID=2026339 RepID=UPI000DD40730|nr:transposase [Oceanibium sediminis]
MSAYLRARAPGGTFFFTVCLARPGSGLLVSHIDALRRAYVRTVATMPLRCDAMVVLPDHLHAVWTLPPGDTDYSERWRRIKHRFSRYVGAPPGTRAHSHLLKREAGLWQRRFWEHRIRDAADYRAHIAYCWADPQRHGLVELPGDWPFSSLGREIRAGRVAPDWRGPTDLPGRFGEAA